MEFLREFTKTQLFFAGLWAARYPDESMSSIIAGRTLISTFTVYQLEQIYDWPTFHPHNLAQWTQVLIGWEELWEGIVGRASDHILHNKPKEARELSWATDGERDRALDLAAQFEQGAINYVEARGIDLWSDRVERDMTFLESGKLFEAYRGSCINYPTPIGEKAIKEGLEFHIANDRYPDSIMRDPLYIQRSLLTMAEDALAAGCNEIKTFSWLNSLPKWVALFPQEYRDSIDGGTLDVEGHLGFWGQFISSRQTLSRSSDRILRSEGRFPLAMAWGRVEARIAIDYFRSQLV